MEPTIPAADVSKSTFQSILVNQVTPSRHQARKQFDEASLKGLAESMRLERLIQPITAKLIEGATRRTGKSEIDQNAVSPDHP